MFFGIPLHPNSREITTFSWEGKQYQFTGVPQGYKTSPIIAHDALRWALESFHTAEEETVFSYVDDLLIANDKHILHKTVADLIAHLTNEGWTINKDNIKGPAEEVKFLGLHWSTRGPSIPPEVINKLRNLTRLQNKAETQNLIGLFGYWSQHIPYLQLLL